MNTIEKIKHAHELKNKAQELLESAMDDAYKVYERWDQAINDRVWFRRNELDSVTIDAEEGVTFCFYKSYCGCCPPECEVVSFSEKFFTDFDAAVEEHYRIIKERAAKEEEEKQKRIETLAKIKEAKERAELAKLKEKYEHTS